MPGGGCGMPGGGPPPPAGASFCAGLNGSCSEYTLFVVSLAHARNAVRTAPEWDAQWATPLTYVELQKQVSQSGACSLQRLKQMYSHSHHSGDTTA